MGRAMSDIESFNLSWDTHSDHLRTMLQDMMNDTDLSDVTLVSDDKQPIKAHKVVLCAASPVFKGIIKNLPVNSTIYLRGIQYQELKAITEFLYLGQVSCQKEEVNEFLKVASNLEIKGLQQSNKNSDDVISDAIDVKEEKDVVNFDDETNEIMEPPDLEVSTTLAETTTVITATEETLALEAKQVKVTKQSQEILEERKPNWLEGRTNRKKNQQELWKRMAFCLEWEDVIRIEHTSDVQDQKTIAKLQQLLTLHYGQIAL